jgi:hypothetical protein
MVGYIVNFEKLQLEMMKILLKITNEIVIKYKFICIDENLSIPNFIGITIIRK